MTEEAEQQGLRPVGDPPMHADDRPVNKGGTTPEMAEDEGGLGPRGETAQHEPEVGAIQGSRRGGGASGVQMGKDNPQPADQ